MGLSRSKWLIAIPAVFSIILLTQIGGCGGGGGIADEVLASGDGVSITGCPLAVPEGVKLAVDGLTEEEAAALAPLPKDAIFAAAAECAPDGTTFRFPVHLNLTIPRKQRPGWRLVLYELQNGAWVDSGEKASVEHDGFTARASITHFPRSSAYAYFLDENWATLEYSGETLVYRLNDIPDTEIREPKVLVSGKVEDQAVIDEVRAITGLSEADAKYLLRSWDTSGDKVVQVLELRETCYISRYASLDPKDKLGRWYSTSETDHIYMPDRAREWYALPNINTAMNYTLYRFKKGAIVIFGTCADMTWSPVFGPYATGGGEQFYAPNATVWVVDHAELNPKVIELIAELRFAKNGKAGILATSRSRGEVDPRDVFRDK